MRTLQWTSFFSVPVYCPTPGAHLWGFAYGPLSADPIFIMVFCRITNFSVRISRFSL